MREQELCLIHLPQSKNYAIISPHRITYGLNASGDELESLIKEEQQVSEIEGENNKCVSEMPTVSIGLIPTFDCNLRFLFFSVFAIINT